MGTDFEIIKNELKVTIPNCQKLPLFFYFTILLGYRRLLLDINCKKNENVYKEKGAKNRQNMELFQKKDLNFAISKFSKFFKKYLFNNIQALLEGSLGKKKSKKNKKKKSTRVDTTA